MNPIEEKDQKENSIEEKNEGDAEIGGEKLNLSLNDSEGEGKGDEDNKEESKDEDKGSFHSNDNEGEEEGKNVAEGEEEEDEGSPRDDGAQKQTEVQGGKEATFENLKILYSFQIKQLRKSEGLIPIYQKFWDLLPHTFEGEITKASFLSLFNKILKLLLPLFNYSEIEKFSEGIWLKYSKGKSTLSKSSFDKIIFKITHLLSIHVNKDEYPETLNFIYNRITRIRKYFPNGEEKVFYPSIKVSLLNPITKENYDNCTWEYYGGNADNLNQRLYEIFGSEEMEQKLEEGDKGQESPKDEGGSSNNLNSEGSKKDDSLTKARPKLKIIKDFKEGAVNKNSEPENNNKTNEKPVQEEEFIYYYQTNRNFYLYNEDTFYLEKEKIDIKEGELNTYTKYELMDDSEIIIYGYPTQFVLTKFLSNPKDLEDINSLPENEYDSTFYITDYQPYENQKIFLKIQDKEKLVTFLNENKSFVLVRDPFLINPSLSLGIDFNEDTLNIINNLRRNLAFEKSVNLQEITLPTKEKIKVNLDHMIMNSTYRKAFGNIFDEKLKKIGIKSKLWDETIENKIETIIKTKFELIHIKLLNLNLSYSLFRPQIESVLEEKSREEENIKRETDEELSYFDKFKSKEKIITENFDNENDLYDEVNKKSPVIFIMGPPRIGKSSVSKKLAEDLGMVYLEPTKFFEEIFKKVADFDEKMLTWDEEHPKEEEPAPEENPEENPEEGDAKTKKKKEKAKKEEQNYLASWEPEPPKLVKPEVDSVLNEVELAVYKDLMSGAGISELNMQRMYMYMLHTDLAISRGVVIDMNSNITRENKDDPNNDTRSFTEKILTGFYGPVEIDYVVELKMDKEELCTRNENMRYNLKTLENISTREIELMQKPKVPQKEILEDEIEYDEEGKPIVPEPEPEPELGDEELEKIPKKEDLLEIIDNEKNFDEQYNYYEKVQKPLAMDYVDKLKTNYYIPVDVTGLDFDDVANLIKCKLDFANPLRPIAKALDSADFKSLLQDGREGVLPYRKWSQWKQIDPVALKDEFLILTGSTEFPATYFGRVFLFVSEENRNKFLQNPKKYISTPPQVPVNYRISIIGPPKSGKSLIAEMLRDIYGWKIMDMEEIFEKVKEYQKTWSEPELNSVYTRRVHFSTNEFKEVLANMSKKPSERKPDNFVSKIVFMLDSLGIPLDKKKTKEQFFAFRKYHRGKLEHMFNRMKEATEREEFEKKEEEIRLEEENIEKKRLEDEAKEEETLFTDMTECARSLYEVEKDKRAQKYADHVAQKEKEKEQREKDLEEKEKRNPYPPEEDYVIEDLRSDQFFLAFDEKGEHPRVSGIILINHPFNEDECDKLKEFNILMDRIIYIKDDSDEGIKVLTERRIPNFNSLKEEKQGEELEKTKADAAKYDEIIGILKERYNVNNEESVIEVGYNEPIADLKLKLENALNPFNIKVDQEDKVVLPADVNLEEKYPLTKGPFGVFCPVIYKEDNWLFYAPEANEVQVNQRVYRISGEKEMEKFKNDPAKYLGTNGSMLPVDVPPPHIMVTGYQGSGVTFFSNVLSKQFRLVKREIQKEFMEIWEKQRLERKEIRVQKKREELMKQNEEIEQKNAETKKENPEAEPEPLINIDEVIKEDAALDEEGEDYNAVENDKAIFKSLFKPLSPTVYDASWNGLEEKISTPFVDLLTESRRVPNVMVVFKVSLKSINERLFNMQEIDEKYEKMLKESQDKRKQKEEELIKQKKQEKFDELKAQYDEEQAQEEQRKEAEAQNESKGEKEEGGEEGEPVPEKMKMPVLEEIQVELTPEEKDEIWNTPDPDLIEKDALIQQEKDRLSQRFESNNGTIQTLIDTLKERGVPVIEINNDTTRENVYTNLLLGLSPYINNRKNLIEKQLVYNREFPTPLSLRKVRDLYYNSEVYLPSVYNKLSPVEPSKHCIRTDYPIVYRDRVYLFNNPEEKKIFEEYPLDYRTGLESPRDCYPMKGRTIIFTVGNPCSGKTTLAKLMSEHMGYYRITVRSAILDLVKKLKNCKLLKDLKEILYGGKATDDNLIINVINRRITMEDLVNENIVIDGFPYTLSQANLLPDTLIPNLIFVAQCDNTTLMKRCKEKKDFKGIAEVIHERNTQLRSHFNDIMQSFIERQLDIRYFDMTRSRWHIKDQILELLQERKKSEMAFARNLSLDKPCLLTKFTPKKLTNYITKYTKLKCPMLMYSPVCLKTQNVFKNNQNLDNSWSNYIVYMPYSVEREEQKKKLEEEEKRIQEENERLELEERRKERQKAREEELKKLKEIQEEKEAEEKAKQQAEGAEGVEGAEGGEGQPQVEGAVEGAEGGEGQPQPNVEGAEGENQPQPNVEDAEGENQPQTNVEGAEGEGQPQPNAEGAVEGEQQPGAEGEPKNDQTEPKEEEKKEEADQGGDSSPKHFDTDSQQNTGRLVTGSEALTSKAFTFRNLEKNPEISLFHFLTQRDELTQFVKSEDDFNNYLLKVKDDIMPPQILSPEKIAEILYEDEVEDIPEIEEESEKGDGSNEEESEVIREELGNSKLSLNVKFEYQDCCPVSIVEDKLMRIGKVAYTLKYGGKYYKFLSMENMKKFEANPNKYINLKLPIRKVNEEQNKLAEKQILYSFDNTVNFLEFTFGSLITKGMLELSNNRIKYPFLGVKESSLKYLALYLKANNPNNNDFAKQKYKKILKDFIKYSKLPLELYSVFDNYNKEKNDMLNKKLIRKQLDTLSVKYDKLMEKAKIQNNTRFANFFKLNPEDEEEK